ncbi:DNA polymerase III subunit delta [Aliarcobacter vitoriensis]|uniref:DNA polymerase III subunit delta n=1 Tax=Aliarcobacter vitoriensis TaxID=2011099 RepID=A0A366MXL8_9BACT|nr:DNA polymerase III subunit delta [Aliarcobacter vitoriensis]RBQ30219.1 DNA polymerase III subunit delta [Aliarcobacter vitoriensis]
MYKNEFDKYLQQNKKFNAYMFYGQSTFLIEQYSSLIAKIVACDDEIEKLYFEEYNFKYAKDRLLQSSLFAPNNVMLIKVEKKIPKKELDTLIEACNINKDSTLILACMGDTDFKSMETSFSLKNNACAVRFFSLNNNEAIGFLQNEAKRLKIDYEDSALSHLYFMHRQDLSLASNDLNKLAILNEKISIKTIDLHCFGVGTVNFDDFLQNLLNFKDISEDIKSLLEEGMNEIFILNQIASFIQQLFMISSHARIYAVANPIEILGYNPPKHIWESKSKLAINIKPKQFLKMLEFILNLELEMKTSKIDNINLYLQASLRKFIVLFR